MDLSEGSLEAALAMPSDETEEPPIEPLNTAESDPGESPLTTAAAKGEGEARYFEFSSDTSNKFWEITLSGNEHTVRFGRLGTSGQTRTKQFNDAAEAKRDGERLIRSKQAKGYEEK